jgi:uncharacterized phage protein (TIGR01671 family)
MRDIKFRIFDKKENKMVFTGFHVFGEVTLFHAIDQYLYETKDSKDGLERYNDLELMQCTGLKDKNGKDIYECDIVKLIEANRLYTAEFIDSGFKLIHADPKLSRMHWGYLHKIKECEFTCEVAGNIHENPELLNQ